MSEVAVRYRNASRPPDDRIEIYALALRLSAQVLGVVERVGGGERFFLRDQLDRKSSTIPFLIKQGLACESRVEQRAMYVKARRVTQDCLAVLVALGQRGMPETSWVDPAALVAARETAQALIDALGVLTVPPPLTR